MKRAERLTMAAMIIGCVLWAGCGDDKPTQGSQTPIDYQVILSYYYDEGQQQTPYLLALSGLTDSIVDSVPMTSFISGFSFSHRDSLACFASSRRVWTTAWTPAETIGVYDGAGGGRVQISQDDNYVFVSGRKSGLFRFPSLEPIFIDTTVGYGTLIPGRPIVCLHHYSSDTLYFVDYGAPVLRQWAMPMKNQAGEPVLINAICVSISGDTLFVAAEKRDPTTERYILVVTTDNLRVLDQVAGGPPLDFTNPLVHPDGRRVFWYYPGGTWPSVTTGSIYVYDIHRKQFRVLLDGTSIPHLFPAGMTVSPFGDFLYVINDYGLSLIRVRLSDGTVTVPLDNIPGHGVCLSVR